MSKATPPVPRKVDPDLRRFLESLKEKTDIGEGQRGDPADRFLRINDLLDMGILRRLTQKGPINAGNLVPNIPLPNMSIPPQPTGVEVTDGFSYVFVTWDRPTYRNHGFTEIWRATEDNLGNAVLVQQQAGQMFVDADVVYGQTYYYWIRFHSENSAGAGRTGPYNSTAGLPGKIAEDPEQLLQQLTDKITASQLHEDLKAPIAQIPSIIDDLTNEIEDRIAAVNTLLGDLGVIDDRVVAAESSITTLQSVAGDLSDGIDANAGAISALGTRITDAEGTITVQAADITALESGLTNANNNITANAGALGALTTRVTTAEGSITVNSDSITSLTAILDNPTTGTSSLASAFSGLNTTITQVDNRVTVEAGRIDALSGQVNDPASGLTASFDAINVLEGRVTSTETGLVAEANARDELRVEILGDEVTDGALATSINDLQATVSSTYATITDVNQLSVNLDGRVGTIEQRASATGDIGKVTVQWGVKAQVGDLIGGVGLYNDGATTQFYVQADTFSVYSPGNTGVKPFIIDNGNVIINTAYIKDGTITSAKIGSLAADKIVGNTAAFVIGNITTGAITNAMIGNVIQSDNYSAGSAGWNINKNGNAEFRNITARGNIEASSLKANTAMVNTANIADLAVNALKIQGQSVVITEAYSTGSTLTLTTDYQTAASKAIVFNDAISSSVIVVNLSIGGYLRIPSQGDSSSRELAMDLELQRNGVTIQTWTGAMSVNYEGFDVSQRLILSPNIADSPSVGTHTYTLRAKLTRNFGGSSYTATCYNRTMVLSGAKR